MKFWYQKKLHLSILFCSHGEMRQITRTSEMKVNKSHQGNDVVLYLGSTHVII